MRRIDLIVIVEICIGLGFGAGMAVGEHRRIDPTVLDIRCTGLNTEGCLDVVETDWPSATNIHIRVVPKP